MRRTACGLLFATCLTPAVVAEGATRAEKLVAAVEGTRADWRAFEEGFNRLAETVGFFDRDLRGFQRVVETGPADTTGSVIRNTFGWSEREALERFPAVAAVFDSLETAGLSAALLQIQNALQELAPGVGGSENAVTFARHRDPTAVESTAAAEFYPLRDAVQNLRSVIRAQEDRIPPSKTLLRWRRDLDQGIRVFRKAAERLESRLQRFPHQSICPPGAKPDAVYSGFYRAAGGPEECQGFFPTSAYPLLDTPVWESDKTTFFFEERNDIGHLVPREDVERVLVMYPMLIDPPRLSAGWIAQSAGRLDAERTRIIDADRRKLLAWFERTDPGWHLLAARGLLPRLEAFAVLDSSVFQVNALLEDGFGGEVQELLRLHDDHSLMSGRVVSAAGEGLEGAVMEFSSPRGTVTVRSKSDGGYAALLPGPPGEYRQVVIRKPGYLRYIRFLDLIEKINTDRKFELHAATKPLLITGVVYKKGSSPPVPVEGAIVVVEGDWGTVGKTYSSARGYFRMQVKSSAGAPIKLSASKQGARTTREVGVSGDVRKGIQLYLDVPEPARTLRVVADTTVFMREGLVETEVTGNALCPHGELVVTLEPGSFPDRLRPGDKPSLEVTVSWSTTAPTMDSVEVVVRAFCMDAPEQSLRLGGDREGTRTLSFSFALDGDGSGSRQGRFGAGVGGRVVCASGSRSERWVTHFQSYRRP